GSTDELEQIDGELLVTDERKRPSDRAVEQSPSMIISGSTMAASARPPGMHGRSRPKTDPPPVPGVTPPPRPPSTQRIPMIPPPGGTPGRGSPLGTAPTPAMGIASSPDYTPPTGPGVHPMPTGLGPATT